MKDIASVFRQFNFNFTSETIEKEASAILSKSFEKNNVKNVWSKCLSFIDLTSLNSDDTREAIEAMAKKVNLFGATYPSLQNVPAICVYPSLVETAKKVLNSQTKVAAVSACFPSAQTFIEAKIAEVALTSMAGADEIDVVISLGKFKEGRYDEVFEEIEEIKAACRDSHLKVILETGVINSVEEIKKASLIAITAGADFIKTSTGKTEKSATVEAALVMCQTIKEVYGKTGKKIGFKPSGGIRTTEDAVKYYTIVEQTLGDEWLNSDCFRFGASSLANSLLSSILGKPTNYF